MTFTWAVFRNGDCLSGRLCGRFESKQFGNFFTFVLFCGCYDSLFQKCWVIVVKFGESFCVLAGTFLQESKESGMNLNNFKFKDNTLEIWIQDYSNHLDYNCKGNARSKRQIFFMFDNYFYRLEVWIWQIQWGHEYRTSSDFGWSIVARFRSQPFENRTLVSLGCFIYKEKIIYI